MTEGTKYHPLFEHLLFSGQGRLEMTFAEIEGVIGARLPPSALMREEWWSNSERGHSQARAWMRASYKTSRVDLSNRTVEFKLDGWPERFGRPRSSGRNASGPKISTGMAESDQAAFESPNSAAETRHPLFGIWKGSVTLRADVDYTAPAFDPDPHT